MCGLAQDRAAFLNLVAIQAHHQRLGSSISKGLQGTDDAASNLIARGDSTENVDEHGANLLVSQDDVQALGHNFCRGTATDIEEIRGPDAPVFTRQCHNVQGRHDQACAVTNHAHLPLQAHVVQSGFLRHGLARILRGNVGVCGMFGVTESGIVIQRHLAVQRQNIALLGQDQGVDFNQGGVFASVGIPQPDEHRGNLVNHGARETSLP